MQPTEQTRESSDAGAIVRSYLAAFDSRSPQIIADHVSDDFINEHTAALATGCVGRPAYLERLPNFLADMVDLHYEIEQLICDQGDVAAFYTMTAKWQGHTPISIRGVQRLNVVGNKITHRVDYWDSETFLAQTRD